jgi:hypothetical protein
MRTLKILNDVMYVSFPSPPHNPVSGSIYFDTTRNELRMYNGNSWGAISEAGIPQEFIDEFDIITNDSGFFKVKLYQEVENGKRGVMICDEHELFIEDTKKAIDFIRKHVNSGYLWIEKRILDHLG